MDIEKLIQLVRNYPELYDPNHEDYMRTKLKNELWEEIAKVMHTDGMTAKDQWRKLRDCHREALRRQQIKSDHKTLPVRLWMYQRQMEFLRPFMKNRASTVGYPEKMNNEEAQQSNDSQYEQIDDILPHSDDIVHQNDVDEGQCNYRAEETNEEGALQYFERPNKIMRTMAVNDPIKRYVQTSEGRAKKMDERKQMTDSQTDALYHFFMSMYNITKELPMRHQRQVRRKLFEVVSRAEDDSESESVGLMRSGMPTSFSCAPCSTHEPKMEEDICEIKTFPERTSPTSEFETYN